MADYEEFERWWMATAPELFRLAQRFRLGAGPDIIQDVALVALRDIKNREKEGKGLQWEDEYHFRNWARLRVRWFALDLFRRESRTIALDTDLLDYIVADDATAAQHLSSRAHAPDVSDDDFRKHLKTIIRKLPSRQQLVIKEFLKGKSTSQVAALLEISESTVRSLQRHARYRISQLLEEIFRN